MAKLSARQDKLHHEAMELVNSDRPLTLTEKEFILDNYKPYAEHNVKKLQAFFTPLELAIAATTEMPCPDEYTDGKVKILDLCAGIGMLSFAYYHYSGYDTRNVELVCVELTEEFARVGQRVLPEATWIVGDMFSLNAGEHTANHIDIDTDFDCFISNPPFSRFGPSEYVGRKGCYVTSQIGMKLALYGVMIVPKCNCPFEVSGVDSFREVENRDYEKFSKGAKLKFGPSCVDTEAVYDENDEPIQWDGVKVNTEIVIVDKVYTTVSA